MTHDPRRSFSLAATRRDIDAQVEEELQFHLDSKAAELVAEGWDPAAARHEAERLFGDLDAIRARCRTIGLRRARRRSRMESLGGWVQDLAYGFRQLRRNPGFALVAIVTLGLGVGATTAIFSVLHGVLLRPLPYENGDRLVNIWVAPQRDVMSGPDILDIEERTRTVERTTAISRSTQTLTGVGDPVLVRMGRVSDGLLQTFGLTPALGRDLGPSRTEADDRQEVVLGYGLWQRAFGGDPDVLGRTIDLNGVAREIVGIAPRGFSFPGRTEAWIPRAAVREGCERGCHTWRALGLLAEGASVEAAQAELDALGAALESEYPVTNTGKRFRIVGMRDDQVNDVRAGLWILFGAVGAVLLIACANVANLLLVRASRRTGEIAVRGALGATRSRLVRQTLLESAALAVIGGLLGLAAARGGVALIRSYAGDAIPRMDGVTVDWRAALFALALTGLITLLFGLSPALQSASTSLVDSLGQAGRGAQSARSMRQRSLLVMSEMALSVVLLIGAGLLLRTFVQLQSVDLGYQTEDITRFTLSLPGASYPTIDEVRTFYRTLETNLAALPDVESVGSIFGAPLGSGSAAGDVLVEGRPEAPPGDEIEGAIRSVSPHYLETMRIPLREGRLLTPSDDTDPTGPAVINESFAQQVFPNEDPIGKRLEVTVNYGMGEPQWTVVGVVGDVRTRSVTEPAVAEIYVPHGQFGPGSLTVALRTLPGASVSLEALTEQVRALDPNLPLRNVETLRQAVAEDTAPARFYLMLVAIFAGLAVLLAAVGLYGVLAYAVSTRTREIGVRVALGADRSEIARMVVMDGMRPVWLGLVLGVAFAVAGGRLMESVLFGVAPRDPVVFGSVPLFLLAVALAAAWIPAARAGGLDPSTALRAE